MDKDLSQMEQVAWHTHDGVNTPKIFQIQPKIVNSAGTTGDNTRAINEVISTLERLKLINLN